jgi:DNA-binding transcriptional LysR family regulator
MSATLGLVSTGWGIALVPDLAPDRPGYPVARIALGGVPLTRQIFVVTRRGMLTWPTVSAVLEVIREQAARVPLTG